MPPWTRRSGHFRAWSRQSQIARRFERFVRADLSQSNCHAFVLERLTVAASHCDMTALPLAGAEGSKGMDINYLLEREQVERVRADRAACSNSRAAHRELAERYRALIEQNRRQIPAGNPGQGIPAH